MSISNRSNPTEHPSKFHPYYLHLCQLALGRFHSNVGETVWNEVHARPTNSAAKSFWNAQFPADPLIHDKDGLVIW
jgi:hypothetical protein